MIRSETTVLGHEPERFGLFVSGLALTSLSLSSGFIWAFQYRPLQVLLAATGAWTGYVVAHYATTGRLVDADTPESGAVLTRQAITLDAWWRYPVAALGIGLLVGGMGIGVVFIRAQDHLATNLGGALFLGGYVLAHYAVTDELL